MDIQSLEALFRAFIENIVADVTAPLISRIQALEFRNNNLGEDIRLEVRDDIRVAVEACVESEVESEVSRQLDNIEIPDEYAIRDMVRTVLRDVTFTVEADI
jgi:hypothetical protein